MKHFGHPSISKGFWKQSETYHILVKIRLWTLADGGEEGLLQIAAARTATRLPWKV